MSTFGRVDVAVVDVARNAAAVGVDVAITEVPLNERSICDPSDVALVPPETMGSVPVTSAVRLTVSQVAAPRAESERTN